MSISDIILHERTEIIAWRASFLRRMREIRKNTPTKPIVLLDETWVNEGYTRSRSWEDTTTLEEPQKSVKSGLTVGTIHKPAGLGRRLMIVHAGSSDGFLPLSIEDCVFEGKINVDGDYHKNMDCAVFECWFRKMMESLTKPSIIVMDNASYHSRRTEDYPTSNWKKE